MKCQIFFSWESDRKASKKFLLKCLNSLNKKKDDYALYEVIRDTGGIPGAPKIESTIFERIDSCDIFVADVTIINSHFSKRHVPNPNVLIELGYAIKALGWEKIIILYNEDISSVNELPFDINHQRAIGFSLRGNTEKKQQEIVGKISSTAKILYNNNQLHGGNPALVSARKEMTDLLMKNFRAIYSYYYKKYAKDTDALLAVDVITDDDVSLLSILKSTLSNEHYRLLASILQTMKKVYSGDEDCYGWEYADSLARDYFDPIYCTYINNFPELDVISVFTKDFIDLYNAISGYEALQFVPSRYVDDTLIFSNDGVRVEAYGVDRILLCKGEFAGVPFTHFTGFRKTHEYDGEFVDGKRTGKGVEKVNLIIIDNINIKVNFGDIRREGIWKDDDLIDGVMHSVLLSRENGQLCAESIDNHGLIIAGDCYDNDYIRSVLNENENGIQYYFADLRITQGKDEYEESNVKQLFIEH